MKWDNTIVDNESDKDTLCIALLYRSHTHIRTNFYDRTVDRTFLFISLVSSSKS